MTRSRRAWTDRLEEIMTEPIASARLVTTWRPQLGRGRLLALLVAAGFVVFAGITVWRIRYTGDLPDIGDPFDLALARRPIVIPDQDNAFVAYAEAHKKLAAPSRAVQDALSNAVWEEKNKAPSWSSVDPGVRAYLERNRAALESWREGSGRPDAVYIQPAELTTDTIIPLIQDAYDLAALAALEASRHEEKGEMGDAWTWHRALLRASRLYGRHGVLIQRHRGARIHALACRQILRWAADPRVNVTLLRQALDDALAADALTSPLSEALKLGYLSDLRMLRELNIRPVQPLPLPGGKGGLLDRVVTPLAIRHSIQRFRLSATNDPEKSRRASRLVYANWLAQVDRPPSKRARIAIPPPTLLYAAGPTAPPAARAVRPEDLIDAIEHTTLGRMMYVPDESNREWWADFYWEGKGPLAREPRRRAVLIVKVAAELYRREHGQLPAIAGDLIGHHLNVLPEGVDPTDPIPAGTD
jgi:hypothetical protein